MDKTQQRIKIAEVCGWKYIKPLSGVITGVPLKGGMSDTQEIPDYLNDLNAIHEAEKVLTKQQWEDYGDYLERMIDPIKGWLHSTAAQRAEAFLRTLGLWEEGV